MEERKNTLYVPVNIKTRFEMFSGFGFIELFQTATVCGISIFLAYILNGILLDFYQCALLVLVASTTTFMAVRKNEMNQSIVDMIKLFFRFFTTQQKYKYVYIDPYINSIE